MEVQLTPDIEAQLNALAVRTGRGAEELIQDALAGYLAELTQIRQMAERRYGEVKNGQVKSVDGETFFDDLRAREDSLHEKPPTR